MANKQGGGSSEKNGENQQARNASRDAGLNKEQHETYRRELEDSKGQYNTYRELRELAENVKQENPNKR